MSNKVGTSNENKVELRNCKELAEKFEALVKINHGWKKDYEKLQILYEMLNAEKRLLGDEKKKLKVRIRELETQQTLLEGEVARFAVYAQQSSNGGQLGGQRTSEEQCEILKSQTIAYKEDFERERADRENLHEDTEKIKHQLEDAEDIIKQLIAELEALEEAGTERRHSGTCNVAEFITDAL